MSKQQIQDLAVQVKNNIQRLMSLDELERKDLRDSLNQDLAVQTKNDIQRLMSLVELERKNLRNDLNQQMLTLGQERDDLQYHISELNNHLITTRQAICRKYGHVFQSTVYHRKIFPTRFSYVIYDDVVQRCVCCGIIKHSTKIPAPKDGEIEPMPKEMEEAIEHDLSPIQHEIDTCFLKLADIQRKIDAIQNRYYDDICRIYGHSHVLTQAGRSICPWCGREVDENQASFLEYLDKLINL